jgi:hypothetical protein
MGTKRAVGVLVAALCMVAAAAMAQEPQGRPERRPGRGPEGRGPGGGRFGLFAVLDVNTNGELSAEEIANAPKVLAGLDKDKDGKLVREELFPGRPDRPREGRPDRPEGRPEGGPPPEGRGPGGRGGRGGGRVLLQALDTDGNMELSKEEVAGSATALKKLDKNADGKLTHDEIRPEGRGDRRGPGGEGPGPGPEAGAPPPPPQD